MMLTDSHTHLYYEEDSQKRADLVYRAIERNVSRMFLPNVNAASIPMVLSLSASFPDNCFPMLGLHPCEVKDNYEEELQAIYDAVLQNKIYAIGEIGIDLYWDKSTFEIQQDAFRRQIQWAKQSDLPVVIHSRDAFDETYSILSEANSEGIKGIFHCFTGSKEQAEKIISLGLHLGIGGVVTYKNSGLAEVVSGLPLESLVLETDSPYLSPVPFRGKPNESSYLVYIAQKVADCQQISLEEVARITTENSRQIFLR